MTNADSGICYVLDGAGGAQSQSLASARRAGPGHAIWYRFARRDPQLSAVLKDALGLDDITAGALLTEEPRPRCTPHGEGALIILRAVNFNPGAEPEDMISFRMWIDPERIVSIQGRPVRAAEQLAESFDQGLGPKDPGEFVVILSDMLTENMQEAIDDVEVNMDELEDRQGTEPISALREELAEVRRTAAALRRFIAPQRDALGVLIAEPFSWQTETHERRLKNIVDRITRLVEQLDEIHLRAAFLQESLAGEVAERLNRTMAVLSVIAGIFLPLTFIAGVLGMNVAGIPFASSPLAFPVVMLVLAVIAGVVVLLFQRFGLM